MGVNDITRRLPSPWRAEKFSGGYVVRDANGFAVAHVYGRSTEDEAMAAKQMTMDEARRVASNIAKLPEMLKRGNSVRTASQLVDEIASDVLPPQGVAIVLTERSRSRCPFWLAHPPSERFCSDRGRTSGHSTSEGELGIETWLCWRRPPCPYPVTFIPNSAFSVPLHPFVAGYEWRWRVLWSRGSAQL
jgi:hypothetical protein